MTKPDYVTELIRREEEKKILLATKQRIKASDDELLEAFVSRVFSADYNNLFQENLDLQIFVENELANELIYKDRVKESLKAIEYGFMKLTTEVHSEREYQNSRNYGLEVIRLHEIITRVVEILKGEYDREDEYDEEWEDY